MNPVIGLCPICGQGLEVVKLHCRHCDTALEGHFSLGRLYQLTPEQLHFVETFIRCEGKINRVEQEMGLSYPAVRSRLNDVIVALGYDVDGNDKERVTEETRQRVLAQLAEGKLTAEEAVEMLQN